MMSDWLQTQGVPVGIAAGMVLGVQIVFTLILCSVANAVAKRILLRIIHRIVAKTAFQWDDVLLRRNVFVNLSHLAPALVLTLAASTWWQDVLWLKTLVLRLTHAYVIGIGLLVISSFLDAVLDIYNQSAMARKRPIKGYIQAVKIAVFFFGGIFFVAALLNKSPWGLFSVLGGLTAVLLLVFKDPILGFVASIQLSGNNMVQPGDWIEMPKYGADGEVEDITLTTVKVRNWDKTITTIPTYALISDSFKNWRGMQESGGRRIKRAVYIDMNTIRFCDAAMIERFRKFQFLQEYLDKKLKEIEDFNRQCGFDTSELINGRRLTNVGTFRAYIVEYLKRHPQIRKDMTFLVRHLAPTPQGLPIEIYVFCADQVWANYEAIQADIFDHILAAVGEFELKVFQVPSGHDVQAGLKALAGSTGKGDAA